MIGLPNSGKPDIKIQSMGNNKAGQLAIIQMQLRPQVRFTEDPSPTATQVKNMHGEAHHHCFLANSVKTEIVIHQTFQCSM